MLPEVETIETNETIENVENSDDLTLEFEEVEEKTQTFGLNSAGTRISGLIDEKAALRQHIYLTLNTEADQFIIYPYDYGIQTLDLIGKPDYYVMAVLPTVIKEALSEDDRILDVSDFEFESKQNKLIARFVVTSIYGNFEEETVVIY